MNAHQRRITRRHKQLVEAGKNAKTIEQFAKVTTTAKTEELVMVREKLNETAQQLAKLEQLYKVRGVAIEELAKQLAEAQASFKNWKNIAYNTVDERDQFCEDVARLTKQLAEANREDKDAPSLRRRLYVAKQEIDRLKAEVLERPVQKIIVTEYARKGP